VWYESIFISVKCTHFGHNERVGVLAVWFSSSGWTERPTFCNSCRSCNNDCFLVSIKPLFSNLMNLSVCQSWAFSVLTGWPLESILRLIKFGPVRNLFSWIWFRINTKCRYMRDCMCNLHVLSQRGQCHCEDINRMICLQPHAMAVTSFCFNLNYLHNLCHFPLK